MTPDFEDSVLLANLTSSDVLDINLSNTSTEFGPGQFFVTRVDIRNH
jgi:hypothetical protein